MKQIRYSEALREALREALKADPRVLLLGEDIGVYGGAFGVTRGLLAEFGPDRVRNTPISETSVVGAAVGAALTGSRPVVEIMFMDFVTLALDPMVNLAAKARYVYGPDAACPLVLRTAAGGGKGYGPTHSQTLEAWFLHVPGVKIAAPATAADAKGLLTSAMADGNPVLFLEHKRLYGVSGNVPDGHYAVPFGKARRVREGADLTLVAWSWMTVEAEAAAVELAARGIQADLLDLRTLNPLDLDAIVESVQKTGRLLIVEEGTRSGGVAAEIGFRVFECAHDYLERPIVRVTAPDVPLSASPVLEQAALPDRSRIVRAALDLVQTI